MFLFIAVAIFSCKNKPDAFKGYGEETTVTRPLNSFDMVKIGQKFRLYITQDSTLPEQITITYSKNLIDKVDATVTNGQLYIRDNNHYNWVRKLDVYPRCTLNIKKIGKLQLEGSVEVTCLDSLDGNQIDLQMNSVAEQKIMLHVGILSGSGTNTGNILFMGRANIFTFSCEDGCWFDARALNTDDAYVWHYTDHDIFISPKNIFEAYVYSRGNLYYTQEPLVKFKRSETGKGRILKN